MPDIYMDHQIMETSYTGIVDVCPLHMGPLHKVRWGHNSLISSWMKEDEI